MQQARRVVGALTETERAELTVIGVSLDPERDTPEKMREMAELQQVSSPLFRLLSGPPEEVNGVLDRLGVQRKRDPQTGIIDHANVFLLVDRGGRIAYRFTLGEEQERWLVKASKLLLAERAAGQ